MQCTIHQPARKHARIRVARTSSGANCSVGARIAIVSQRCSLGTDFGNCRCRLERTLGNVHFVKAGWVTNSHVGVEVCGYVSGIPGVCSYLVVICGDGVEGKHRNDVLYFYPVHQ